MHFVEQRGLWVGLSVDLPFPMSTLKNFISLVNGHSGRKISVVIHGNVHFWMPNYISIRDFARRFVCPYVCYYLSDAPNCLDVFLRPLLIPPFCAHLKVIFVCILINSLE